MSQCPDCEGSGYVCSECGAPCKEGQPCEACGSDAAKTCPFCHGTGQLKEPDGAS